MTPAGLDLVQSSASAALLILALAFVFAAGRLARGPSLPDRVVALNLMSVLAVGIVAAHCLSTGNPVYLDAAIILALISFLGTVAFAHYVALRGNK